ncbi:lipocalin family protein [Cohaesibacter haloalkalitolerans]|uniref:lipocalin family protein n=1 Tax=Cohaesibacter haloalkalitolerans TaxID=1162980 RepID=UPI000E64689F|nr:lipocalin family protein [Cohaesibacter haloalkalitolerans]
MPSAEMTPQSPSLPLDGPGPLLDAAADLVWKPDYENDSWFYFGQYDVNGETINYLFHAMIIPLPEIGDAVQLIVAISNETTGWYKADDRIMPLSKAEVKEGFDIKMPNGFIRGTLGNIDLEATLGDGSGKIALHIAAPGPVIFNAGVGEFTGMDMHIHQYSIPRLATSGTIEIEGKSYQVEGTSWFDRQWQLLSKVPVSKLKWSWIGMTLDTGEALSVWSCPMQPGGSPRAWATILKADGTQMVIPVDPTLGATGEWKSDVTNYRYPTHWTVRIPEMDAVLDVDPRPLKQEVVSREAPVLSKYEGASRVTGTWQGKSVTGFGYVELVGNWS